ncbi:MAG: formate dehydrogenase accessory protein FdhE [Desulfurococcales archaeon]|nr:formate dehydrogenase accessory protein FdhE [Desulfurococcales archaeon]
MEGLDEFKKAIAKYGHFFKHARVDKAQAISVEEIQQTIASRARVELDTGRSLEENVEYLNSKGLLAQWAAEIGGRIGDKVDNPGKALEAALEGRLEEQGARAMLLAIQAVARSYADKLLERGVGYEPSARCPVCGLESRTMVRRGRWFNMICHFCGYEWRVSNRMVCPYCGESNPVAVGVYGDKARRVMLAKCHTCNSTWRVVMDETIRAPRILLPLIALKAEQFQVFANLGSGRGDAGLEWSQIHAEGGYEE